MIEILNKPIYDSFIYNVKNADLSIKLCAPFIKSSIVDDIYTFKRDEVKLDIITNINLMSFIKKSSDVSAIKSIVINNDNVFNSNNLHAKFYIFDNSKLIITSANLTTNGMKHNFEYGIITDDIRLIKTSLDDFYNICKDDDAVGKIQVGHIDQITKILNDIPVSNEPKLPSLDLVYEQNDDIFSEDISIILNNLAGWKRSVFNELNNIDNMVFTTSDFKTMIPNLIKIHPKNNNIEAKIRQTLQVLRDIGLVKFEGNGVYHKLWK